ncbi:hypothetical protein [Natrononativus amylolyticus]|uniref:hypothetical protein n=1 Tax=Natrononativus amylolyticus TaxID=2963434 RepID=UPI0020CEA451|nr:hypothetical protein [Natrononativus amylolyticus]
MDRSSLPYVALHYVLLLVLVFGSVVALERSGFDVPLWLGVVIAIVVGLLYPRLVREMGFAPEQWE